MSAQESPIRRQEILPEGDHLGLFEVTHGELHHICQLRFSSLDHVVTGNHGWVAGVSGVDTPSVICWNAETRTDFLLPLPDNCIPAAVSFVGQVLYVGGRIKENLPFLALSDLGAQSPQWKSIELPSEVLSWGKAVDVLLMDGARLIVIDDIVTPCWLLTFDVSEPLQPELSTIEQLEPHGTYESVSGASVQNQWIAVLTKTMSGWSGLAQHIALIDKRSLKERAAISVPNRAAQAELFDWSDVDFWGDLLLVAAGKEGIGILDLSKIDHQRLDPEECRKHFYYTSLPGFRDEQVLRIFPATFADCLAVVLKRDRSIRSILLRRQDLLNVQNDRRHLP